MEGEEDAVAGGIPIKKDSNKCCLDDFSLPPTSNQPRNSVIVICAREIETKMSSSDEDAVVIWLNRPSLRLCPDTGEQLSILLLFLSLIKLFFV